MVSTSAVYVHSGPYDWCSHPTFLEVGRHVKVIERKGYVSANLCGEVRVKSKPF